MSRVALGAAAAFLAATLCGWVSGAGAQPRHRTTHVGNLNVMVFGVGALSSDHPNFDDEDVFENAGYQRRVWRREMRRIPVWIRGAVNFASEDRRFRGYTIWREGENAIPEPVLEHTSDATFRFEMLFDLVSRSSAAVYAGGGVALHYLSFSSDGVTSQIPIFKANESKMAPSLAAGVRFFTPHQPLTAYAEFRFTSAYGKTDVLPAAHPWLTDQSFEFTRENAWTVEGGLGFHW